MSNLECFEILEEKEVLQENEELFGSENVQSFLELEEDAVEGEEFVLYENIKRRLIRQYIVGQLGTKVNLDDKPLEEVRRAVEYIYSAYEKHMDTMLCEIESIAIEDALNKSAERLYCM